MPERRYRQRGIELITSGAVDLYAASQAREAADPIAAAREIGAPYVEFFAAAALLDALANVRVGGVVSRLAGPLRWLFMARLVVEHAGAIEGPVAIVDLQLDRSGQLISPPLVDLMCPAWLPPMARQATHDWVLSLLEPALLAFVTTDTRSNLEQHAVTSK